MKIINNTSAKAIMLSLAGLIIAACTSPSYTDIRSNTTKPVAVNASKDNSVVLENLETGLIATLVIDGDKLTIIEPLIRRIPKANKTRKEGETVTIRGMSDGKTIAEIHVPDNRLNIQEHKGIILLDKRTISFSLPLPTMIDSIEITMSSTGKSKMINLSKQLYKLCKKHRKLAVCKAQ